MDELAEVADGKRRADLLSLLTAYGEAVPTGDFVVGTSRVGMARLSSDASTIDGLRSPAGRHIEDALIGGTALFEGAYLVTYERRLTNRATAMGINVIKWDGLLDLLS